MDDIIKIEPFQNSHLRILFVVSMRFFLHTLTLSLFFLSPFLIFYLRHFPISFHKIAVPSACDVFYPDAKAFKSFSFLLLMNGLKGYK